MWANLPGLGSVIVPPPSFAAGGSSISQLRTAAEQYLGVYTNVECVTRSIEFLDSDQDSSMSLEVQLLVYKEKDEQYEEEEEDSTLGEEDSTLGEEEEEEGLKEQDESIGNEEETGSLEEEEGLGPPSAKLRVIRIVNGAPILDGAEGSSCGLVQAIYQSRPKWRNFGIEISLPPPPLMHDFDVLNDPGLLEDVVAAFEEQLIPTFEVRDTDQVQSLIRLMHGYSDSRDNIFLPAHERLGNMILIVKIEAKPELLPLPTLSKVRFRTHFTLMTSVHKILTLFADSLGTIAKEQSPHHGSLTARSRGLPQKLV